MNRIKDYIDNSDYKAELRATIIILMSIVLIVGINVLISFIPQSVTTIDLSTGRIYSISSESKDKAESLSKPVDLILLCEKGKENKSTVHMLDHYGEASDMISVAQIDPVYEPDKLVKYTDEGTLESNSVIVASGDKFQILNYSDYYSGTSFVLEDMVNGALDYVTGDSYRMVYNVVGHNEVVMSDRLRRKIGLDGFRCEDIDLSQVGSVPEDARALIINGIKGDLSSEEAEKVLAYLKKGGKLILATDYSAETLKNLDKITGYFGAHLGKGVIVEASQGFFYGDNTSFIIPKISDEDQVLVSGVSSAVLPNAMPITVDADVNDIYSHTIFETTENSVSGYVNPYTGTTESKDGPFIIGGSFSKQEDGSEGQMIWVSSRYFSGEEMPEDIDNNNLTAFLNAVSEFGADEPVPSINGKIIASQLLKVSSTQASVWRIILIVIIPLVFIAIGLFIIIKRKNR